MRIPSALRISRGRILKRTLPRELGGRTIYVSPNSALKYLRPGARGFDPLLMRLAASLVENGAVVWDIGANVGAFTFAAAPRASKVLAVEPDPFLASLLRRSRGLNSDRDVEVLSAAISQRDGVTRLSVAERGRSANTIDEADVGTQRGSVRETLLVPTLRLDTLLDHFPAPTLLKIDVEGAEALALRGSDRLLREIRPTVVIEVAAANEPEVRGRLLANGYALFDAEGDLGGKASPIDRCAWNTVARPLRSATA